MKSDKSLSPEPIRKNSPPVLIGEAGVGKTAIVEAEFVQIFLTRKPTSQHVSR